MRCTGWIHDKIDIDDPDCRYQVSEAILTPTKLTVDWKEDGEQFHLRAGSEDNGTTYKGNYGPQGRPVDACHIEFTRYDAQNKTILLLGNWFDTETGDEAQCIFILEPTKIGTKKQQRT